MSSKDTQNSNETQSNDNMNTYINDLQDLDILTIQSNAQLILILAYYFEYIATQQAMELIYKNINSLQESDDNSNAEESQNMMNESINSDKIAFLAAKLEIYAQTIITRLDYIKLQRFLDNTSDISSNRFALTRTANKEIFIGAMFAQIGYIFNFEGVKILYSISNTNPLFNE